MCRYCWCQCFLILLFRSHWIIHRMLFQTLNDNVSIFGHFFVLFSCSALSLTGLRLLSDILKVNFQFWIVVDVRWLNGSLLVPSKIYPTYIINFWGGFQCVCRIEIGTVNSLLMFDDPFCVFVSFFLLHFVHVSIDLEWVSLFHFRTLYVQQEVKITKWWKPIGSKRSSTVRVQHLRYMFMYIRNTHSMLSVLYRNVFIQMFHFPFFNR